MLYNLNLLTFTNVVFRWPSIWTLLKGIEIYILLSSYLGTLGNEWVYFCFLYTYRYKINQFEFRWCWQLEHTIATNSARKKQRTAGKTITGQLIPIKYYQPKDLSCLSNLIYNSLKNLLTNDHRSCDIYLYLVWHTS